MKILSMIMAALLVASLMPATLADVEVRSEVRTKDVRTEARAEARTDELRERMDEERTRFRERTEEARTEIRERVREHRERVRETKERFRERRDGFVEARAEIRVVCSDGDSEVCAEARARADAHAHDFLDATVDRLLTHLDRLEAFVNDRVEDEDARTRFLVRIDELRAEIDAVVLPEEPIRDDLRRAARALRDVWHDVRDLTKDVQESVVEGKVSQASQRLENLESRLYAMRDDIESRGGDVAALDRLLVEFSAELEASASAGTARESQEHFRNAVQLLREIMHEIRDARAGETGSEELELEVSGGNVELDAAARETLEELRESFSGEGKVKLKLKVTKDGNETSVETSAEGNLTAEQEALWNDLQAQAEALVAASDAADAELELEIEYEAEVSETEPEDGESEEASDAESDAAEAIEDAEEEIEEAEEKIAEAAEDGEETSASAHLLAEAKTELAAANENFEAGLYAEAEVHAEAAADLAADARMKWLGKTLAELEAEVSA